MTYTHGVWNQKDTEAALEALSRYAPTPAARQGKAPTEREEAYLAAVDVLYGEGEKAALDTAYAREMAGLADEYPDDMEAQTFYALSLLGLSQGDRNVPTYMEAGTIALSAFQKNKNHPGAAHYTIHSFDDPTHAILAMEAAQTYGPIAPEAAHAQHMTTHIFLARGMWDDVVETNIRADALTDRNLARRDIPPTNCGHYDEWLLYGYQQQGRYDAARQLLMACYGQGTDERFPEGMRRAARRSYVYMRGLYLADTRTWDGDVAHSELDGTAERPVVELMQAWGSGMAAVHRGDRSAAQAAHAVLMEKGRAGIEWESPYVPVWQGTLAAALKAYDGDMDGAVGSAREAADYEAALPVDFGPPIAFKPAREYEADLLLAGGRAADALTAYEAQLARTPKRTLSLAGLARAAIATDQTEMATDTYRTLSEILSGADADMPEALEARAFLSGRAVQPEG